MDDDGTREASVSDVNKTFLSPEELVSLRKHTEDSNRLVIGSKLYTQSESCLDDKSLEDALENYKSTLNKKRAGRICDVMQAEWSTELNAVIVSKLKGKFTQHMGHMMNGKHVLSPEESIFLLENGCIEIINGGMPMSTEEAYNIILKGNLGLEKYQVYSHLSQLGFIVVPHQAQLGVTQYEKEMNLDKHPLKKKRQRGETAVGEPEKKRLTFTGVFSVESKTETSLNTVQDNSTIVTINETDPLNTIESCEKIEESSSEKHIDVINGAEHPVDSYSDKPNDNEISVEQTIEDHDSVSTEINQAALRTNQNETDNVEKLSTDLEPSKEKNMASDSNLLENCSQNEGTQTSKMNTHLNIEESMPNTEHQVRQECVNVNSRSSTAQSSKDIHIMDVDTDADPSETSRDNFNDFNSNINATSQDSYCAVINNDVKVANTTEDVNSESNFDVVSCSSVESEDDDVLALDCETNENLSENNDEVTLIEVTKKETKPLAVIELLSDDDELTTCDGDGGDDEIRVIEEYPGPSSANVSNSRANNDKLFACKKEHALNISKSKIGTSVFEFPYLFQKDMVCVAPPPSKFLPSRVRPSKEVYILKLKDKSEPGQKVWNSYLDMQAHQRDRRNGRYSGQHNPRFQNLNSRPESDRNFRSYRHQMFGPNMNGSLDQATNSHNSYSRDFNGNMYQSMNSYWNESHFSFSNPAPGNSVINYRPQNMNANMAGNNPNVSMPNFQGDGLLPFSNNPPLLMNNTNPMETGGSNSTQFMAEVHRTAIAIASNMLSTALGPRMLPYPHLRPMSPSNFNLGSSFNSYQNYRNNDRFLMPNEQRNFSNQRSRARRGQPFPCQYRNIGQKRSWNDVRSALCESGSDSEIEEVPPSLTEVLWDSKGICPLVKPGIRYPVATVLKFLQITQKAKVTNKYCYSKRLLPNESTLEISFDVYLPGSSYKKTNPSIPKHRIIVVRSTDPIPKYSDIVVLQRKWNDNAFLQIAVVDNGDISFHSFNSITLPSLIPHQ